MAPLNVLGSSAGVLLSMGFGAASLGNCDRPLTDTDVRARLHASDAADHMTGGNITISGNRSNI